MCILDVQRQLTDPDPKAKALIENIFQTSFFVAVSHFFNFFKSRGFAGKIMQVGSDAYRAILRRCGMPERYHQAMEKRLFINVESMDQRAAFIEIMEFLEEEEEEEDREFYLWHIWFTSKSMNWNINSHPPSKRLLSAYVNAWTEDGSEETHAKE